MSSNRTTKPATFGDIMFSVLQKDGSGRNVRFDVDYPHGMPSHVNVESIVDGVKTGIGPNSGHIFVE